MERDADTLLLPDNIHTTEASSGQQIRWPGTDERGDFQGRPDDANTPPSYLDSAWLSKLNRFVGRVFNARGAGQLSKDTSIPELVSSVSPFWMAGGLYVRGMEVLDAGGVRWVCTVEHTATAENAPGKGAEWVTLDEHKFNKLYPIGTLYSNATSDLNPSDSSLLGFGTWVAISDDSVLQQKGTRGALGQEIPQGLPEIEGNLSQTTITGSNIDSAALGGAFYNGALLANRISGTPGNSYEVLFAASRSSSIYGASNNVQPKAVIVSMWSRVA